MKETPFREQLQIDLCSAGIKVYRNVVSLLYSRDGHPIKVGTEGQADLIGWVSRSFSGQPFSIYISIETKSANGRIRKGQPEWARAVERDGGIALLGVRPGDDVIKMIRERINDRLQRN